MSKSTLSEDTFILSALDPKITDANIVFHALERFFEKKKEIDYNDRYNGIIFTKKGPQYLEDFTLDPEYLLRAIEILRDHTTKADVTGGIFLALTYIATVFKRIGGKAYRLIILTDRNSTKIPERQIPFLEDLIHKAKDMPFYLDVVRIDCDDPSEDLKFMRLCRRTGGDLYEIKELIHEEIEWDDESSDSTSLIERVSKRALRFGRKIREETIKPKEETNDLFTVLDILAEKKDVGKYIDRSKVEIDEINRLFYESLGESLVKIDGKIEEKCTICFRTVKNQDMMKCPVCEIPVHKICSAIWAKTSNVGIPHLFRCHNCYALVKLDEVFIELVNSVKTPEVERVFEMEDIVLEEYLHSLEESKKPRLVTSEDYIDMSQDEIEIQKPEIGAQVESVAEEELQIIWCPNCGKMTSNEYIRCPQCDHLLKEEKVPVKKVSQVEKLTQLEIEKKSNILSEINRLKLQTTNDIKSELYNEAIEKAQKIIDLAKEIKEKEIEQEYGQFIVDTQKEIELKKNIIDLKKKFVYIKEKYDILIEDNKIREAYLVVKDFIQGNEDILSNTSISSIKKLEKEAVNAWEAYLDEKELMDEVEKPEIEGLVSEEKEIEVETTDLGESESEGEEKSKEFEITREISDQKQALDEEEKRIQGLKEKIAKIEEVFKESAKLVKNLAFNDALELLESTVSEIDDDNLSKYKTKLKEKIAEINVTRKDINATLVYEERKFKRNESLGNKHACVSNCKNIIDIAEQMGETDTAKKYSVFMKNIEQEIQNGDAEKIREQEQLIKDAREIENILQVEFVEDDVIPLIKNYSEENLKQVLSKGSITIVDHIVSLLKEFRMKISSEVKIKMIIFSELGEVGESEDSLLIRENKVKKKLKNGQIRDSVEYAIELGLGNPLLDIIEDATIITLIPYLYDIVEFRINGRKILESPNKVFRKTGLEWTWKLKNLRAEEKIEIEYSLVKRIFRTIMFTHKRGLSVLRIPYSIKEQELEGSFEALLPFSISEKAELEWLVIEDIIPAHFIPAIIEPKDLRAVETSNSEIGKLIGWVHQDLEPGTYLYLYKFLDSSQVDEIKLKLAPLFINGSEALTNNDLIDAIKKSKEISEVFEDLMQKSK